MWFCIKCGKRASKEDLIRGYCVDCFKKYIGVFKQTPIITITICPRCGSWLHRGEWNPPSTEAEILEVVASHELRKYMIDGAQLLGVYVTSWEYTDSSLIKSYIDLDLFIDEKHVSDSYELSVKIVFKTCSRCISRSIGKYSYLVQIRFTNRDRPHDIMSDILNSILTYIQRESVVDIKEVHEGLDIELDDNTTAKKILEVLVRKYSARVNTSFRSTRYDPHQGRWIGVTTYVARIPVFKEKSVVVYRGKVCLVKTVDRGKLVVWIPESNSYEEVDIKSYWKNELKLPVRIEVETFLVKHVDEQSVVLESTVTGDTKIYKARSWLKALKTGEQVALIKVDGIETIVPKYEGG